MKDKKGNTLNAGDRFSYMGGPDGEVFGEIFDCGGVDVIKWEDDNSVISVVDFYYAPGDQRLLAKIFDSVG